MSRYDVDKFVPLPDQELICCICTNVLDEPVESPCRHVFCRICIETWINNKNNCPTCRSRVTKIELKPVLPLVRNMLNKLTLMCDFINNGCKDLISLEKYPNHIETCDYESVICRYPNCAKSMLRKIIRCHEEEECPCREILCSKDCGLRIPFEEIITHDCLSALKAFGEARNKQTELLKAELTELRTKFEQLKQEVKTLKKEASRRRHSSWESSSSSSQNSDYSIVRLRSRSPRSRSRSPSRSRSHSLSRSPLRSLHTSDSSIDSFPLPNRERDEQEAILNSIGIITNEHAHGPPRPPTTLTQPFNANGEHHSPIRNNAPTHGYRCIMCDEIYEYCTCVREPTTTRDTEEDFNSDSSHYSVDSFGEGQFSPESDLSNSDVLNNSARTLDNNAHSPANRERSYTSTASSLPSRIEDESSQDGYSPTACSSQSRRNEDLSGSRSENNNGYSPSARLCTPSSSRYLHLHSSSERVESALAPNEKALINSPTDQIGLPSREHSSSIQSDYSPTCISKDQSSSTKYWSHWGKSPVGFVSRTPSPHTSHSSSPHSKFSTTYSPTGVSRNELHNVLSSSDCSRQSLRRTSRRLASSSEENSESEHEVSTPHSEHVTDHSFNGEDDTSTSTPHSEFITDQSFNREYDTSSSTSDNQDHNSSHSHDSSGSDADAYEHGNRMSGTESSMDNSCRSSDTHFLSSSTKKKVRCRKRKRSKQLCATESWSTTESESSCTEYETKKNRKRCKLTMKNDKYKTDSVASAPTTRGKHGEDINTPSMSNQYVTRSSARNSNEILNAILGLSEELLSLHEAPSPERPQTPKQIINPSNSDDNPSVQ